MVLLSGTTVMVKAAHVRLCHSRMLFVRAYPRETQEMVFDAHDRAFVLFKGTCSRGIYDNTKTAAETIFVGKDRREASGSLESGRTEASNAASQRMPSLRQPSDRATRSMSPDTKPLYCIYRFAEL